MHPTEKGLRIPVVVVVGATGTGKSALAATVGARFSGVVINADSRQTYADFPVITAQPNERETSLVPHRLYGFLPTEGKLGAGPYATMAAQEISATNAAGRLPVLVGGTGLYVHALLSGIALIPPVDPAISRRWQQECAERGAPALHAALVSRDPETATRLHPNDGQRIARALEVLEGTGKPLGYWHSLPIPPAPYTPLIIHTDMPLAEIAPRIADRVNTMIETGAVSEAQAAYAKCADPTAPGWSGIGCAELFLYTTGQLDFEACKTAWIQNTRAYAKRQITWFKRDKTALRLRPEDNEKAMDACALFLKKNYPL